MVLDCIEKALKIQFHAHCFHDELLHLVVQETFSVSATGLRPFGNHGPNPLMDLEPAFLDEVLDGFVRGVGVNLERGSQSADRGEGLAGLKFAADEGFLRGKHNLVGDGLSGLKLELEYCHMDTVTLRTDCVKDGNREQARNIASATLDGVRRVRVPDLARLSGLRQ